jgi:DNA primase
MGGAKVNKDWVDFRVIKAAVSMQMVVEHYDLRELRKSKNELRGRCPIHKGDGERTFHINLSKNAFQCFSCKAKGNVLDFVAAMESCSVRDAALKLQAWFTVGESRRVSMPLLSEQQETADQTAPTGRINPPLPFQLRVDSGHNYGLGRGLTKETLEHFGAGLCVSKGTFSGRFVIPLHNEKREIVGYAGRSLDDSEPRYLFPSNEKGFYKSHLLFNLHRALEDNETSFVAIVEGLFSPMKLWQAGIASVSLLGSSLSEAQEDLICRHFNRVVLLFDGDDAGRACTDDCATRLTRRAWVRAISLPDGCQPDQLSKEEILRVLSAL